MSKETTRKIRWIRFGLRSLLVAWTLVALWLGIQVNRVKTQVQIVNEIGEVGHVIYEHEKIPMASGRTHIDYGAEAPGPRWLRDWLGDDYFRKIVAVNFTPTDILMDKVSSLSQVQSMAIVASELSDVGFRHLGESTRLTKLSIKSGHGLTDEAFSHIGNLGSLEILWVDDAPISNTALSHLEQCEALKDVVLRRTLVTQEGVDRLKDSLPNTSVQFFEEYAGNSDIYRLDVLRRHFKQNDKMRSAR